MSYSQAEVQEMLRKIADAQNLIRGQVQSRFESLDKDYDALKSQLTAIERAVALAAAPGGGEWSGRSAGPFNSLGEQLVSIARAAMPGGRTDERLLKVQAAASGMGEGVPSEAGFLIQPDFSTTLLQSVFQTGKLASRINRVPISATANGLKAPAFDETARTTGNRLGGIRLYWTAEGATLQQSKPKLRMIELTLKKLTGLAYASDELLQDSAALGRILETGFRSEFGFEIDNVILRGTGAGQPLGILNAGSLISVSKETGQAAATVVAENVIKMWARLLDSSEANAVWLVSKSVLPQLYTMSLSVGTGGAPIFTPAGGLSGQPFNSLLGKPLVTCEQCSALGDQGDVALVDLSQYVWIDKGGVRQDSSIHVKYLTDEMTFRWVFRCDGQPLLASAITPYKGANTLSPFVTLEAR